jgi:hypothetical protein
MIIERIESSLQAFFLFNFNSKQKLSATSASDEFEQGYVSSAAKKVKTSSFSKGFGDFSAW